MSFNQEYDNETKEIQNNLGKIKNIIVVMSGKGGVGKSTVAANLAGYLSSKGLHTGLLDIDLHGPSVPKMLGLSERKIELENGKLRPVLFSPTLQAISIGFMLQSESESIIWRGPKKNSMVRQFLKDVHWRELDYLIVDCPPGTGDEQLSIIQTIGIEKLSGAVIVTTPQEMALIDVKKSINFCKQLKFPIIGIVENMSGLVCPKCKEVIDVFKSEGGKKLAAAENISFLGKISLDPSTTLDCDSGRLTILTNTSSINQNEMGIVFNNIEKNVKEKLC